MSELIRILETDNKKMVLEKEEAEESSRVKQEEVYTLLDQVQCLEGENQLLNEKVLKVEELNFELNREAERLREEIESEMLELRSEREKG